MSEEPDTTETSDPEAEASAETATEQSSEPADVTEAPASDDDAASDDDDESTTAAEDEPAATSGAPISALLRHARDAYAEAIRAALAAAGLDDLPKNGADVLGGLRKQGDAAASSLSAALGTSKQAVSQLLDQLELKGYVDRHIDPEDRRKLIVSLTEHGRHAAEVIDEAARKIDADLTARVGEEAMAPLHRALHALEEIGNSLLHEKPTPDEAEAETKTDADTPEPAADATGEVVSDEEEAPSTEADS